MSHQQQTLLESFRNSTIEKSIKLASERLSHQRKLFVNNNNNNSTASKKEEVYNKHFLEPHLQTQSNFIHNDFGLIASVATPAQLINDPTQDQQILVQSNRVTCFAKNNTNNNNSNLLFSGFDDGSISIWSVPDGKWIAHGVPPQNDNNNSFSGFSTRGISVSSSTSRTKLIASTHRNGSLALWKYDLDEEHETKERKQFHPYHVIADAKSSSLRQCEFSPIDENILAVSNDNGTVQIYSTTSSSSSSPLLLLSLENGIPPSLLQQTSLGSSSSSSLTQHQQNQQFKTPETRCLSFHPDGALLAVGDSSGSFSLWDLRDGSRIYNSSSHKPLHSGRINDIVFSKNSGGYNFFSAGDDGLVYCFDLRKLSPNTTVSSTPSNFVWRQAAHGDAVSALCLHPKNDDILFSGGLDGNIVAWDAWTGDLLWSSSSSSSSPSLGYIPGPQIGKVPPTRAVKSLAFCRAKSDEKEKYYLTVARREPEWLIYSNESGSFSGNRSVQAVQLFQSHNNTNCDAAESEQQQPRDKATDESDDDSSSDDDDILGKLKGK